MRRSLSIIVMFVMSVALFAQSSARDCLRMGNKHFRAKEYDKAETNYRKSIALSPSFEAYYNLANTCLLTKKDSLAEKYYQIAIDSVTTNDPSRKAFAYHNVGNLWYTQALGGIRRSGGIENLQGDDYKHVSTAVGNAIHYYKSSLRCNPSDNDSRYNLAIAQFVWKKLQKNDNNGGGGGDGNDQDQNKDEQNKDQQQQGKDQQNKDKQDKDKKDQNQNDQSQDDKQDKDKDKGKQNQQNPNQNQQKNDISDQAAAQLLQSAHQDEKNVQQKINKNKAATRRSLQKDW